MAKNLRKSSLGLTCVWRVVGWGGSGRGLTADEGDKKPICHRGWRTVGGQKLLVLASKIPQRKHVRMLACTCRFLPSSSWGCRNEPHIQIMENF